MYTLKKFFLGESDGKKEAASRKDFENFFYDHNGIFEEITQSNRYLILGNKGTGKTILAEYIKKKEQRSPLKFCEIVSFADFQLKQLKELRNSNDTSPNEFISIWTWIIFLELGKLVLKDQGVKDYESLKKLEVFFKNNFDSIDISTYKLVEVTEKKSLSGGFRGFNAGNEKNSKMEIGEYYQYLESLVDVVQSCIRSSSSKYTLMIDELDNRFRKNTNYSDNLYSLLKAADRANHTFLKNGIKAKVIIFLRTDIFNLLNGPDLNKIRMDSSVALDWGTEITKTSSLFKLLLFKIKQSVHELSGINDEELFDILFPQPIKENPPEKFILQRTLFRPRDIIAYLNFIIKKYPDTKYFGAKGFVELEREYSEKYFVREARNELYGHINDEMIDEGFQLLGLLHSYKFTLKQVQECYLLNKKIFENIDVEEFLRALFKIGMIGNMNETEKGVFFTFSYINPMAVLDVTKTMILNRGLRKALDF